VMSCTSPPPNTPAPPNFFHSIPTGDGPRLPRASRPRRIDGRQRGVVNFEVHQDTKQGSVGDL
jgi:hypothetical protein